MTDKQIEEAYEAVVKDEMDYEDVRLARSLRHLESLLSAFGPKASEEIAWSLFEHLRHQNRVPFLPPNIREIIRTEMIRRELIAA